MANKKYCMVVATPIQALNILNYVEHCLVGDHTIDLFINASPALDSIACQIRKEGLFDHIYPYRLRRKESSPGYYFYDFRQAAFPGLFLREILIEPVDFKAKDYDVITITSGHDVEMALVRLFPKARQVAIEDGLGSYVGDLIHDHKLSVLWRMFGRKMEKIRPECLLVNNVSMCRSTLCPTIVQLPRLDADDAFQKRINRVFASTDSHVYLGKRFVYLTQPLSEIGIQSTSLSSGILKALLEIGKENVIIRRHPRDLSLTEGLPDARMDNDNQLWELVCAHEIAEETVLISVCSTAQIIPKMIYNREPRIVFLYELFKEEIKKPPYEKFREIHSMIAENYSDRDRIMVPRTLEEFKTILRSATKERT